jgi:hypothetical protein
MVGNHFLTIPRYSEYPVRRIDNGGELAII